MVTLNATTSPVDALQTVNDLTIVNGIPLLSMSILFFIWFIIYYRSKGNDPRGALAAATFFTSIIGILLSFLGLVPDQITGLLIAGAILSIIPLINR